MIEDFEIWKRMVEDCLFNCMEPQTTDAELTRYFEAGLPPAAAVHRIIGDRQAVRRLEKAKATP